MDATKNNQEKKSYSKPQVTELGKLNQFVASELGHYNQDNHYINPPGYWGTVSL